MSVIFAGEIICEAQRRSWQLPSSFLLFWGSFLSLFLWNNAFFKCNHAASNSEKTVSVFWLAAFGEKRVLVNTPLLEQKFRRFLLIFF